MIKYCYTLVPDFQKLNLTDICVPTSEGLKQNIISVIKSLPLQGQNVLVQYWGAKRIGKTFVLTTTCQPYGLYGINQELELYRKACLTQNLHNDYPKDQCPPCEDAIFSRIWGSFAVPVIVDGQCVGVLDFVMDNSMYYYDHLIAEVCRLLEHEGLHSSVLTDIPRRACIKINSKKRMRRTKSLPHTSYSCLVPFFGLSSAVAAEMLGLTRGTFRNTCRMAGLPEWPGIPSKNTRRASSAPDQTRVNQALSDTSSIGTPVDDSISSCSGEEAISEWSREKTLIPMAFASATCISQKVSETGHIDDDFTFYWDGGVFKGSLELITTSESQVACHTDYIEAMPELDEMYYQGYDTQIACDTDYTVAMPKLDEMDYQGYETTVIQDPNDEWFMQHVPFMLDDAPAFGQYGII
ncbi:RWP-RK domain-containing protein [Tanacetum coccineum]